MPRKTPRACRVARARPSFNEAAARCRGKLFRGRERGGRVSASMRPRPDAAENPEPPQEAGELVAASMRPRPDAAENRRTRASVTHPVYRLQ